MFSRLRISMITLFQVMIATILILCLPSLFTYNHTVSFQPFLYVFAIEDLLYSLSKLNLITVFSNIWSPYSYSMILLASAFFIAFTVAIILSILYMIFNQTMKAWIKRLLFVMEAIPDVMIIGGIQALLIWFLKQTGQMPFQIINFGAKKAYVIPILCLCILPSIQLFRMLILHLEDEQRLPYVLVVRGKGFSFSYIVIIHLLRNVCIHLFHHAKTMYGLMLSNLFILEYIFNMNGIMMYLISYGVKKLDVSFLIIILFFIPYTIFDIFGSLIIDRFRGREEGIA